MPIEDAAQSPDDKMTIDERFKYLRTAHQRYAVAGRKERSHLLNDMEAMTGLRQWRRSAHGDSPQPPPGVG